MTRLGKRHLAVVFAAILVVADGLPEHALRWVLPPAHAAGDLAIEGFSPGECPAGHPPPELLALADWPLDPESGCRPAADTVVTAVPPPAAIDLEPLSPAQIDFGPIDPGPLTPVDVKLPASPPLPESRYEERQPLLFAGTQVDDGALDELRGGFETAAGLVMSFGIERLVYINGALTSMTRLNVADLGQLRAAGIDPALLPSVGSTLAVIQNGPNNSFVAEGLASGAFATVIQNSLDNQRIQAVTTINATVNSLELMRAHRLGESLRGAVSGAMIR